MNIGKINGAYFSANLRSKKTKPQQQKAKTVLGAKYDLNVITAQNPKSTDDIINYLQYRNGMKISQTSSKKYKESLEAENIRLEALKELDSDKFLNLIPPIAYIKASKTCEDGELLRDNIKSLNSLDEKIASKINYMYLDKLLQSDDFCFRSLLLSRFEDDEIEKMDNDDVTKYLLNIDKEDDIVAQGQEHDAYKSIFLLAYKPH